MFVNKKINKTISSLLSFCITFTILFFSLSIGTMEGEAAEYNAATVVFNKNNVNYSDMRLKSEVDEETLAEYIKKYPKLKGISEMLVQAQDDNDVNLILLLAIIRLESGNGTSKIAMKKNNLGGIVSGKSKGKTNYRNFESKDDCVGYMADLLDEKYLDKDGVYHSGYTIEAIAKKYSGSKLWSSAIKELVLEIQKGINKIK